jgi:hypothetical protein
VTTNTPLAVAKQPILIKYETAQLDLGKLKDVSTEDLKKALKDALSLTADSLLYLAGIWSELESRGEDLSALRIGIGVYLQAIASDHLLPEVVVKFCTKPSIIDRLNKYSTEVQQRVLDGEPFPWAQTPKSIRVKPARVAETIVVPEVKLPSPEGAATEENPTTSRGTKEEPRDGDATELSKLNTSGALSSTDEESRQIRKRVPDPASGPAVQAAPQVPTEAVASVASPGDLVERIVQVIAASKDPYHTSERLIAELQQKFLAKPGRDRH